MTTFCFGVYIYVVYKLMLFMMVKDSTAEMFIISNTNVYGKYILQPPLTEKYNIDNSTKYTVTTSMEV